MGPDYYCPDCGMIFDDLALLDGCCPYCQSLDYTMLCEESDERIGAVVGVDDEDTKQTGDWWEEL